MIIGISGKIGAGKDTLAACIWELDINFKLKKFAGKLKQIAWLLTGVADQHTQKGKQLYLPEWDMTIGEIQQKIGTDAVRNGLHKDAWVLALFSDYVDHENWIITDVRFENEVNAILERGGVVIRIDGTRIQNDARNQEHISETALDNYSNFTYRFDNSSLTMDELKQEAHLCLLLALNKEKYNDIRGDRKSTSKIGWL